MIKLLILADDFTGALDTGVQFATRGAVTSVVTDPAYNFASIESSIEVLVMVTNTRHLPPQEAYSVVHKTVKAALGAGISHIYMKTDSALRGNIGSELAALVDATGTPFVPFIPALPKFNRTTKNGIHYICGVPVAESVFGQDPFEPVTHSAVTDILTRHTALPTVLQPHSKAYSLAEPGIQIFDAETDTDLQHIGNTVGLSKLQYCAGCSGFASVLADLLNLKAEPPQQPLLEKNFFVVCGSVNPVTVEQLAFAQQQGFTRVHLSPTQKLDAHWLSSNAGQKAIQQWLATAHQTGRFIVDVNNAQGNTQDTDAYAQEIGLTLEQLRVQVSENLAALIKRMMDNGLNATLLCTGGDTLLALMQAVGVSVLTPICEMATGVVLTKFVYNGKCYHIITKSGGFGEHNLLVNLAQKLASQPTH